MKYRFAFQWCRCPVWIGVVGNLCDDRAVCVQLGFCMILVWYHLNPEVYG